MVWISLVVSGPQSEPGLRHERLDQAHRQEPKSWVAEANRLALPYQSAQCDAATPTALKIDVTPRQLECLAWVAQGKSATEIGIILGISGRTVEKHIAKICEVFGVVRRIQAVDHAWRLGLIPRR